MAERVQRFGQLCARRGEACYPCAGELFRVFSRVARPIGPIVQDTTLSPAEARGVARALRAWVVWWTSGPADAAESDWYAVVCRRFTPLEEVPSKHRSEIRRGLKGCEVRRLDAEYVSRHGYECYVRSYARYRGAARPQWNEAGFRAYFAAAQGFEDITHFWGAFADGRLIALAANDIYDKVEAMYWLIKLDPEYLKLYPAYALIHTMNEFYLAQEGFQYVNDGWRSLVHETEVQGFLERKFGFQRMHRFLELHHQPPLALLLQVTPNRLASGPLARFAPSLTALRALEQFRRRRGDVEPA